MTAESHKEKIEREIREARAKLDAAKRRNPERFNTQVTLLGTNVTAKDLENSSRGRVVSGQSDGN